ncbi:MAG: BolA family protein [Solirubrobacteraceae bacterium]
MTDTIAINRSELKRYISRVDDRWTLQEARLGGARVADERGALPQRERGPEFVVVLVSDAYNGMPWLERVYQAASLWDAFEMGDRADVHCYTPGEYGRKLITLRAVQDAAEGIDLLAEVDEH